ncbi:MAG: SDR family oxidoreductase [Euryarchaeota archaeon]|nr:SDR family oxidoreductase [Euryarchaeota archaeon]
MDLRGRAAIVTGGARNIGRAIAIELARSGANVCVNYLRSEAAANRAVRELVGLKSDAFAVRADVTKAREAKRLVDTAAKRFGHLDILVNNVGDFIVKSIAETTEAEWRRILESNLTSMFLCTKAALPHLRKRKWGRIVNIACAGAYRAHGTADMAAYYAAKAGVVAFTKALAREEGSHNITANAVAPGIVSDYDLTVEEAWKAPRKEFAIPRAETAWDVAYAVAYLCSEEAGFVTGNVLNVTGGWLL